MLDSILLQRFRAGFARTDANGLVQRVHENFSVADLAGIGCFRNGLDDALGEIVIDGNFQLDLGQKRDEGVGASVTLCVTRQSPESLHFRHGDALHADLRQRFPDIIELEQMDDCSD